MDIEILLLKFYDYSSFVKGYSKATIARYKSVVSFYIRVAHIAKIEQVTEQNVKEFLLYGRTVRHWKTNSFISFNISLRVFFAWCVKEGYLKSNPTDEVEIPKVEKRLPPKLTKQDTLRRFRTNEEKYELSHLYEDKIKNMGNAGRNGGEYYTPRPLIKTIVKIVDPKIGDKIYDGAVGSAGFLCEAFDYLKKSKNLTTKDLDILQKKTFFGKEKASLAYIIGTMNMILHGVEAPNIVHTNTLAENISEIQEKDRYDVVLANPPFGGGERVEVQQNFPIKTGETAFLFLQHFIKSLKAGGKAGIVIKNTFLSNTDNASVSLRKLLLESCNLHTVLDLPGGSFVGAGVKTVVLFFEKGKPTQKVWFYQLNLERNLGKTNPLSEKDLADFVKLQKTKTESENSWSVSVKNVDPKTFDLSAKNPNKKEEAGLRDPKDIVKFFSIDIAFVTFC